MPERGSEPLVRDFLLASGSDGSAFRLREVPDEDTGVVPDTAALEDEA